VAASLSVLLCKRCSYSVCLDIAGGDIEMKYADDTLDQEEGLTVSALQPVVTCLLLLEHLPVALQADGGVTKRILKAGNGWEKPEKGDQVFGEFSCLCIIPLTSTAITCTATPHRATQ